MQKNTLDGLYKELQKKNNDIVEINRVAMEEEKEKRNEMTQAFQKRISDITKNLETDGEKKR
jgi:hypothetical protein